jgi:hypothetical protein
MTSNMVSAVAGEAKNQPRTQQLKRDFRTLGCVLTLPSYTAFLFVSQYLFDKAVMKWLALHGKYMQSTNVPPGQGTNPSECCAVEAGTPSMGELLSIYPKSSDNQKK